MQSITEAVQITCFDAIDTAFKKSLKSTLSDKQQTSQNFVCGKTGPPTASLSGNLLDKLCLTYFLQQNIIVNAFDISNAVFRTPPLHGVPFCIYIYIYLYICICLYISIYLYICINMQICIYRHGYRYTYINTCMGRYRYLSPVPNCMFVCFWCCTQGVLLFWCILVCFEIPCLFRNNSVD